MSTSESLLTDGEALAVRAKRAPIAWARRAEDNHNRPEGPRPLALRLKEGFGTTCSLRMQSSPSSVGLEPATSKEKQEDTWHGDDVVQTIVVKRSQAVDSQRLHGRRYE